MEYFKYFGQRKDSKSYKRWVTKYYRGQKAYEDQMSRRKYTRATTQLRTIDYKPNPYKMARDIAKLKRGQLAKEYKYHDVTTTLNCTTTGQFLPMSLIAQGDTSMSREGLQIRLQSIQMHLKMNCAAASTGGNHIRLILFMDTEQSGSAPTADELLEADNDLAFPEKHENRGRFKILWDKRINLNLMVANTAYVRYKDYYKKYKKYAPKVHYTDSGATQAHQGKNNLYLYYVGDEDTNYATVQLTARLRFTG